MMRYTNATTVLPEQLIQMIQQYVDGEAVYIPRKHVNKKAWGEKNGTRKQLMKRNQAIYEDYRAGKTIDGLMSMYYLSEKSIYRILRERKRDQL